MLENKIINNGICHIKVKSCIMDLQLRKGILALYILPSCWSLGTHCHLAQQDHLSSFPQPWYETEEHMGSRGAALCWEWAVSVLWGRADSETRSILPSACRSQEDRSTHLQCLLWSAPVDSLGVEIQRAQCTFLEHCCCQATVAYGGLTRRVCRTGWYSLQPLVRSGVVTLCFRQT